MTRHNKKTSDKTAAPAAVETPNETQLQTFYVAFEGRTFEFEAVDVFVNGNHYTFIGKDGEGVALFPTALTGIVRL